MYQTRKGSSVWVRMLGVGLLLSAFPGSVLAASWCVNPGVSTCMATIGAAIAAASAGDVITVAPGTYKESVKIGVPLTLIGSDATKTIIDATGLSTGIYVDGIDSQNLANVVISGFTVQNANFEGILVTNASAITVASNIVQGNDKSLIFSFTNPTCPGQPAFETAEGDDCGEGIHLIGVDHAAISGNTVTNNAGGILLSDETQAVHDNVLSGNTVSNNALDCGITLASHPPFTTSTTAAPFGVYRNTMVDNQVTQNGLKGFGAGIGLFSPVPGGAVYANVVLDNTATGNGLPGVTIHAHTPGQNFNNNVIIGNQISGNGADSEDAFTPGPAGINFLSVSPVTGTVISGNTISQETDAVVWHAPGVALVNRNTLTGTYGVLNLGTGTVSADNNWWGCNNNPTNYFSALFGGCSLASGSVSVNTWLSSIPAK